MRWVQLKRLDEGMMNWGQGENNNKTFALPRRLAQSVWRAWQMTTTGRKKGASTEAEIERRLRDSRRCPVQWRGLDWIINAIVRPTRRNVRSRQVGWTDQTMQNSSAGCRPQCSRVRASSLYSYIILYPISSHASIRNTGTNIYN